VEDDVISILLRELKIKDNTNVDIVSRKRGWAQTWDLGLRKCKGGISTNYRVIRPYSPKIKPS
jgi:energy-converting hydrogenase A subunit M